MPSPAGLEIKLDPHGVEADLAVALSAVRQAGHRDDRTAKREEIVNTLLMRGEKGVAARIGTLLAVLYGRGQVSVEERIDGLYWRVG